MLIPSISITKTTLEWLEYFKKSAMISYICYGSGEVDPHTRRKGIDGGADCLRSLSAHVHSHVPKQRNSHYLQLRTYRVPRATYIRPCDSPYALSHPPLISPPLPPFPQPASTCFLPLRSSPPILSPPLLSGSWTTMTRYVSSSLARHGCLYSPVFFACPQGPPSRRWADGWTGKVGALRYTAHPLHPTARRTGNHSARAAVGIPMYDASCM